YPGHHGHAPPTLEGVSMSDPRRALIVLDLQQEYFDGPLELQYPPHAHSLPNITRAIDAAAAAGTPIAAIQHTMGDEAPVFNPTHPGFQLTPEITARHITAW